MLWICLWRASDQDLFREYFAGKTKQAIGRRVHRIEAEQVAHRRHLMAAVQF